MTKFTEGQKVQIDGWSAVLVRKVGDEWVVRFIAPGSAKKAGMKNTQPESALTA
jgi:hypothetical protein